MMPQSSPHQSFQLAFIENCLCLVTFAAVCFWPATGAKLFSRLERFCANIACRPRLAILVAGLSVVLIRLAILPIAPIPLPINPDDFSFLLAADTFALGRLTNPTPVMWPHFETIHVTMYPTYMSMYFPAQGLLLAAGKVLLGHPWFGLLIIDGLMCAAICWMLQAWLPRTWAFAGAMIAVLRLGLFSYWINSYTGAGCVAALGGALVLGALPRLTKGKGLANGWWLAVGISILMLSRPYEGMLLCVPVALALGHWVLFAKNRPAPAALARAAALPLLVIVLTGSWMAYYDYRSFGNPLTLPYTADRTQYAVAPYYIWQSEHPAPVYRHAVIRDFYTVEEMKMCRRVHSLSGYVPYTLAKLNEALQFYAGPALLIPLIMFRRALFDRRIRFLVICLLVLTAGMVIEIYLVQHYLAPFTCVMYALGLQAMRHLRVWQPGGRPVGLALVRAAVSVCFLMGIVRVAAAPLKIVTFWKPESEWMGLWYGPDRFGTERADVQHQLDRLPGKHLVLVRYDHTHYPVDEWVYNSPDIDNSKTIWAREMDKSGNEQLIRYYPDRQVWLVQPDLNGGPGLTPYPGSEKFDSSRQLASLPGPSSNNIGARIPLQ